VFLFNTKFLQIYAGNGAACGVTRMEKAVMNRFFRRFFAFSFWKSGEAE